MAAVTADFLERIRDARGLARELHGGRVGQVFPLPGHAGLDDACEQHANATEYGEPEADDQYRASALAAAAG